jgi:uncharacterized protein with FMN-binding domain
MPIRGELSILAAILTLGHNVGYGKTYFVRLFTDAESMGTSQLVASVLTVAMLLIVLPLTVLSFPSVRRRLQPKRWKSIQRLAYGFYALLYVHVMVLCVPQARMGRSGYLLNVAVYSLVFIGYAVCRVKKYLTVKKRVSEGWKANAVCALTTVVLSGTMVVCARPVEASDTQPVEEPSQTTTTTEPATVGAEVTTVEGTTATTVQTTVDTSETSETSASETSTTSDTTSVTSETSTTSGTTTSSTTTSTTSQRQNASDGDGNGSSDGGNDDGGYYEEPSQGGDSYEESPQEPEPEPEPTYVYYDGTYTGTAYGYDGDVEVTVTIENDVITSISGYSDESDPWYFDQASASVYQQILDRQDPSVDAVSGATYSSNAIMSAVRSALDSARR